MIKKMVAVLGAGVLALTGCSAGGGNSGGTSTRTAAQTASASPTHAPSVVLSMPASMTAGQRGDAVIESYGHAGETAKLYNFPEAFGTKSACTDTKASYETITLADGRQPVSLDYDTPGDTTVVLIGNNWKTDCGGPGSVVRVLDTTKIDVWAADTASKGQPFKYKVAAGSQPSAPLTEWDVTVRWLGPYASAPEAKAATCDAAQPVALTADVKITKGQGAWGEGARDVQSTPTKPGVYRLVAKLTPTQYNASTETTCGAAPLVAVS